MVLKVVSPIVTYDLTLFKTVGDEAFGDDGDR
jgi:hypothetical protein